MSNLISELRPYTKAIIAGLTGLLNILMLYVTLSADGKVTSDEINIIIGAVIVWLGGTAGVYQFPNKKS